MKNCNERVVSVEYTIMRFQNIETKQYYSELEYRKLSIQDEDDYQDVEIELDVICTYFHQNGIKSINPEKCSPNETEINIISALDKSGVDWVECLTQSEIGAIIEKIEETLSD